MSRHSEHFDAFQPHTQLKHSILQKYLGAWGPKLALDGRDHSTLGLVDAFAGEGADREGRPGSPLIMIEAANKAREAVAEIRSPPEVEVLLIERRAGAYRRLKNTVETYPPGVRVENGTLADHMPHVLSRYSDAPLLIFMDPYGIQGLNIESVRRVLAGPQHEVLIQFNGKAAERLFKVAGTERPKIEPDLLARKEQGDLFEAPDDVDAEVDREVERRKAALERTQEGAREYLRNAFGEPEWGPILSTMSDEAKEDANEIDVYAHVLSNAGAPYVTRLPIYNARGKLQYVLLHASEHPMGRRTIKEAYASTVRGADSDGFRPPNAIDSGHPFRRIPATCSRAFRPAIPADSGHPRAERSEGVRLRHWRTST